jgi:hypothetical protein
MPQIKTFVPTIPRPAFLKFVFQSFYHRAGAAVPDRRAGPTPVATRCRVRRRRRNSSSVVRELPVICHRASAHRAIRIRTHDAAVASPGRRRERQTC